MDSVMPTAATASAPSLDTKNTSTTANRDSMNISITIGTARRKIERPMEPWVKSCFEPRTASHSVAHAVAVRLSASLSIASQFSHRDTETQKKSLSVALWLKIAGCFSGAGDGQTAVYNDFRAGDIG